MGSRNRLEGLEIRRAHAADRAQVLLLMQSSLGWLADSEHAAFFSWKHDANPFGPSPAWVAVDGEEVVGFRTFLKWEFLDGDRVLPAVRAVDTATRPDHRGRGIFSALTLHALAELEREGVGFVFNTPNASSRPGYLRMGWRQLGRLPARWRPRSPAGLLRAARARVPADLWSVATGAGRPADEALADPGPIAEILAATPHSPGLRTNRTPAFLRWRYAGFTPLAYRVTQLGPDLDDGFAVFRLRRRGPATEATVCDVVRPPGGAAGSDGRLLREILRRSRADYTLRLGWSGRSDIVMPRQGPLLACRALGPGEPPPLRRWQLRMGDIELF